MDIAASKLFAAGLMSLGMLGAAIGIGLIFSAMITGAARNPAMEGKLLKYAFIGAALAEFMGLAAIGLAAYLIFV